MDTKRIILLGVAVLAALGAVLLVRGMLGGGTPKVNARPAPQIAMSEVLVASENLQPGQALMPSQVRWQKWPTSSVDAGFITHGAVADEAAAVKGTVVRTPMVAGEPITSAKIVHADAAGFMAAMLSPGMRAVSIPITTESGAGGFVLPNDRIDLILTTKTNDQPPLVHVADVLKDVRVLAVDQTYKQDKDQKVVLAKTATLELTPSQAMKVARVQAQGTLSLSLRPLSDSNSAVASAAADAASESDDDDGSARGVAVIRFGVSRLDMAGKKDSSNGPQ